MTNGAVAFQPLEITRMKNLGYKSHAFVSIEDWRARLG
jgi:hypothetical protein